MFRIENLGAVDRLQARFQRIVNPDATPLMARWEIIIAEDNRKGVLAGLDKNGMPLVPVTYRPITPKWDRKLSADQRNGRKGSQRGVFSGYGPAAGGLHNNLTTAEYQRLGGPPLAPRGKFSRVITNLQTDHGRTGSGGWQAFGYWDQVVSIKGDSFLKYHFHGIGQKVRDLTGVRPAGVEKARESARNWMLDIVRSGGSPGP